VLLDEPALREATLSWIGEETGAKLSEVVTFAAERVNTEGTRPDVEGLDSEGLPLLMIEAKFGAELRQQQIESYMRDQVTRLNEAPEIIHNAALVLLVPEPRIAESRSRLEAARLSLQSGSDSLPLGHVASWTDLLNVWKKTLAHESGSADSVLADVLQFEALCQSLGGRVRAPFEAESLNPEWRQRLEDYRKLTDEVTRRLTPADARLAPIKDEGAFLSRRYFPAGLTVESGKESAASVGIQTNFADSGNGAVWLRFNRKTGGYARILACLRPLPLSKGAVEDERGLWLPLALNPDLAGVDLVEDLVGQVESVQRLLQDAP